MVIGGIFVQKATKKITVLAVLTALSVICSLTFPLGLTFRVGEFIELSPAFLPICVAGSIFGWKGSGIVAVLSDLIQGALFGSISPLILLVNLLSGIIFGLLLHKQKRILSIILAVLLTQLICSMVFTTLVLCLRYGMPLFPTIYWRMLQTVILIAIEIPTLYLFISVLDIPNKLTKTKSI
jgi:ECF transporter S component (folate family)